MSQTAMEPNYNDIYPFCRGTYTIDTPVEGGTAKVLYCFDKPVMSVWNEIPFGINEQGKPTAKIQLDQDNNSIAQYQIAFLLKYTNVGFPDISVQEWNKFLDFGETEMILGNIDTKDELGSPHIYMGLNGIDLHIGAKKGQLCSSIGARNSSPEQLYDMLLEALLVCGDYGQALIERYQSNPICREAFIRKAEHITSLFSPKIPERSPYLEKVLNQATHSISKKSRSGPECNL